MTKEKNTLKKTLIIALNNWYSSLHMYSIMNNFENILDKSHILNRELTLLIDDMNNKINICATKTKLRLNEDVFGPVGASRGPRKYDEKYMQEIIPKRLKRFDEQIEDIILTFRIKKEELEKELLSSIEVQNDD